MTSCPSEAKACAPKAVSSDPTAFLAGLHSSLSLRAACRPSLRRAPSGPWGGVCLPWGRLCPVPRRARSSPPSAHCLSSSSLALPSKPCTPTPGTPTPLSRPRFPRLRLLHYQHRNIYFFVAGFVLVCLLLLECRFCEDGRPPALLTAVSHVPGRGGARHKRRRQG